MWLRILFATLIGASVLHTSFSFHISSFVGTRTKSYLITTSRTASSRVRSDGRRKNRSTSTRSSTGTTSTTTTSTTTISKNSYRHVQLSNGISLFMSNSNNDNDYQGGDDFKLEPPTLSSQEENAIQWELFTKHQAKGKWRGIWTTYDYMGDIMDETIASVNLVLNPESQTVQHTHEFVKGKVSSDCKTCFDSQDVQTIHVANYSPENIGKYRCASIGMCAGPSLTKSGTMSTELVLTHGNGRLRVIYQHAPVWERGVEPGSCPPQALKLFRTMVSREVLNSDAPPSQKGEEENPPLRGDPKFFRKVPPFQWHQQWGGSSWTWGPQSGDRGWSIEELEEADAWHGRPTGDTDDVWAMRLPGGILLQCPRIVSNGRVGLCRLAWLPEEEEDVGTAKLLRVEAGILALEPVIDEENDVMLGFYPPELASLRCDVLQKIGVLENVSMIEKLKRMGEMGQVGTGELDPLVQQEDNNGRVEEDGVGTVAGAAAGAVTGVSVGDQEENQSVSRVSQENDKGARDDDDDDARATIRNALKL